MFFWSNGSRVVCWPIPPPIAEFTLQNITVEDVDIRFCDGDAEVVRDSTTVNIDAGRYDE